MIVEEYVKCAVYMARDQLQLPELYICPEVPLSSADLGVDGLRDVSGKCDYATALADTGPNTGTVHLTSTANFL
jgi:hypothetical protein